MIECIFKKNHLFVTCNRTIQIEGHRLKVERWRKRSHENANEKKAAIASLVRQNIVYTKDQNKRHRKALYNDKGVNLKRGCNFVTIYAPNIEGSKYIKQILIDIK